MSAAMHETDRIVGTVRVAAVNVNDLLTKLTEFTLRYGVALDLYIDHDNLVIFAPRLDNPKGARVLTADQRRVVGLEMLDDLLGRIAR